MSKSPNPLSGLLMALALSGVGSRPSAEDHMDDPLDELLGGGRGPGKPTAFQDFLENAEAQSYFRNLPFKSMLDHGEEKAKAASEVWEKSLEWLNKQNPADIHAFKIQVVYKHPADHACEGCGEVHDKTPSGEQAANVFESSTGSGEEKDYLRKLR